MSSSNNSIDQYIDPIDSKSKLYPENVQVLKGNIIQIESWKREDDERILICQQCNCVATKGHGLSETVFKAFPFANIYEERRLLNQTTMQKITAVVQKTKKSKLDENEPQKKLKLSNDEEVRLTRNTSPQSTKPVSSNRTPVENRGKPGTVEFRQEGDIVVANMLGQFYTGKSDRFGDADTSKKREQWFQQCLDKIEVYLSENAETKTTIAFPWKIGCGLAGGIWTNYLAMIMRFAVKMTMVRVVLIKFE